MLAFRQKVLIQVHRNSFDVNRHTNTSWFFKFFVMAETKEKVKGKVVPVLN
jgi:hypothetical protein